MAKVIDAKKQETKVPIALEEQRQSTYSGDDSVFEQGNLSVEKIHVDSRQDASIPKPIFVVSPTQKGQYPLILFLHGFFLLNTDYTDLFSQIASYGFIVVAPQLYRVIGPCSTGDVTSAGEVADWMLTGLQPFLPKGVETHLSKLVLAGHSRGGHAAFSLALGHAKTRANFSVLLGVDPVGGMTSLLQTPPKILTYKPSSFELGVPVLVFGSGLRSCCAPPRVNHEEFYSECKPPKCHVVVENFGHLDMLDDGASKLAKCVCKKGRKKELMRKSIAGFVVAFLRAFLHGNYADLEDLVHNHQSAPTPCKMEYSWE